MLACTPNLLDLAGAVNTPATRRGAAWDESIIVYDRRVAAEYAELLIALRRSGRPRGAHDLLIAATARATSGR